MINHDKPYPKAMINDGKLRGHRGKLRLSEAIDWSSWDSRISNKEVLGCLKGFHEQQSTLLEQVLKEDGHGLNGLMGWSMAGGFVKMKSQKTQVD